MSDISAIKKTVFEYQRFYNDRRVDDIIDLFTEDGVLRSGNVNLAWEGRTNIRAFLESYLGTNVDIDADTGIRPGARLVNPVIDVDGDTATVDATFFALLWLDDDAHLASMGTAAYRLARHADRWRIKELNTSVLVSKGALALLASRGMG